MWLYPWVLMVYTQRPKLTIKYKAPLSKRNDGERKKERERKTGRKILQCLIFQHLPIFGKLRIYSPLAIQNSSHKIEIKNCDLKYLDPVAFFLSTCTVTIL